MGGELLGGCDIVDELAQTGALRSAVDEALAASSAGRATAAAAEGATATPPSAAAAANGGSTGGDSAAGGAAAVGVAGKGGGASEQALRALTAKQPVMLFMKARWRRGSLRSWWCAITTPEKCVGHHRAFSEARQSELCWMSGKLWCRPHHVLLQSQLHCTVFSCSLKCPLSPKSLSLCRARPGRRAAGSARA